MARVKRFGIETLTPAENREFRFICNGFIHGLGITHEELARLLGYADNSGLWRALNEHGASAPRLDKARTLRDLWGTLNTRDNPFRKEV